MKNLIKFDSHASFEATKNTIGSLYVCLDDEHVHYIENIPTVTLPLGADGVENGYGWVDLGLPSGKKWAMCNVGATTPCEPGLLFQFGRVDGYAYGDTNNQFRTDKQNTADTGSQYIPLTASGKKYGVGEVLDAADDAASVNMGGNWHMPTKADMDEIIANTTNSWVTCDVEHDGEHTTMLGRLFISNTDTNKKLFIPAAGRRINGSFRYSGLNGFVWSASVSSSNTNNACGLYLYSSNCYVGDSYYRFYGYSVRGVC